ncbi:MAG TPA: hypothetical protein VEJ18_22235, partial [Planctomycetota bacterium]|nr:hypothetical protein [Planctomycetota bacterium]
MRFSPDLLPPARRASPDRRGTGSSARRTRLLPAALLAGILLGNGPAGGAPGAESPWVRRDLDRLRADWLAVAPPEFAAVLEPLCELRARTMSVAVVRVDDLEKAHDRGAEGISKLVAAVRPRFLLLAGDVPLVAT